MKFDYILYTGQNFLKTIFSLDGWAYKAVLALLMFFAPLKIFIASVIFLVIVDVATAIWAAIKKGEGFSSRMLRQGLLEKLVLYHILLISAYFLGHVLHSALGYEPTMVAAVLAGFIDIYEISSIIENILIINPNLVFLKKFKGLLSKVQDQQVKKVEEKLGVDKDETEEAKQ